MCRSSVGAPLLALVIALGSTGAAFAIENEGENSQDVTAALAVKTSLSQAIASAEQQTGGKAIEAGFENENGRTQIQVSVAKDHSISDVTVDSTTGKVVKVEAAGNGEEHEGVHDED